MQYETGIPFSGAVSPVLRQQALGALTAKSPFAYQGSHGDVYANLAQNNATDFARAAQAADMDAMQKSRDMQAQMALRGLEQMARGQDNSRQMANQIYGNQTGFLNGVLSSLYR